MTGAESMRHLVGGPGPARVGFGGPDETIAQLEFVERFGSGRSLGEPAVAQAAPNLIEAYLNAGRPEDAAEALAVLEERPERQEASGRAPRQRGATECSPETTSSRTSSSGPWSSIDATARPSSARTELSLGERLRRARRRADAAHGCGAHSRTLERLEATPWKEEAHRRLADRSGRAVPAQAESALR